MGFSKPDPHVQQKIQKINVDVRIDRCSLDSKFSRLCQHGSVP